MPSASKAIYNKVFEAIKSNLIPKSKYEKSQNEVSLLKSELESAKDDLRLMKMKYANL